MNNESWKWDAEAALKRIEAFGGVADLAAANDAERMKAPYTPPPNVAAWLRKHEIENPKGRDYEALTKAALRKPVGYWEDAPRGMKFAQDSTCPKCGNMMVAGHYCSTGGATAPTTTPPADGPYEPVNDQPRGGDRIYFLGEATKTVENYIGATQNCHVVRFEGEGRVFYLTYAGHGGSWRILKRPTKPHDDVATGARVWRDDDGFAWVQLAGVMYGHMRGMRFIQSWCRADDLNPKWELHGPERDAIIAECKAVVELGS